MANLSCPSLHTVAIRLGVPSLVLASCKPSPWASAAFELQKRFKGNMTEFSREERNCWDGALPHGSSSSPAGHPSHTISPSPALLVPYLKASQPFLLVKQLQLPQTRHSSRQHVIASREPDVDRRHTPSPAGTLHPLSSLQTGTFALRKKLDPEYLC